MFVQADLPLELPFGEAAEALDRALSDGGLIAESRKAFDTGLDFVMPVGPRGSHFPARDVAVHLLPARRSDRRVLVALRWETKGPSGKLFPALDADLELSPGDDSGGSRLSIIGRYQPPLSRVGQTLDRVVMSRIASATMTAILREVASKLQNLAGPAPSPPS
jgi:hypothetical protein